MRRLVLLVALVAAVTVPGGAAAHEGEGKGFFGALASFQQGLQAADIESSRPVNTTPPGPCTEEAKAAMPVGAGHDHKDMRQHGQRCRMESVKFLPLLEEIGGRKDAILGEMDIKADIAAVAITFPKAGILFFDVSNPVEPKFLSRYDSTECDQAVIDINCGAFVDLSGDGKTAFLSVQKLSFVPGQVTTSPGTQQGPGVEVVDLTDPRRPVINQAYPVAGIGGVHTSRWHQIPTGPSSAQQPRRPGEYVFSNQNGVGIDIARVRVVGGRRILEKLPPQERGEGTTCAAVTICVDEVHDTFIQNDPIDGRTYLYNAAGFDSGFQVYDVTDPERVRLIAEWDLTPECEEDWYSHTIDVTHRDGRRYVTMPAELFLQKDESTQSDLAEASQEEQNRGCGKFVGNGDKPGPLWIVDATDFSKLQPAEDNESAARKRDTAPSLKKASEATLVATWTNPAGRAGGSLTFSPHNQQIFGDLIFLSHYHGGVYVLDASAAFSGKRERPTDQGFIVPNGEPVRPLLGQPMGFGQAGRFFTDFPLGRPEIWDMVVHRGHVMAADMTGGFYSLRYLGRQPAPVPAGGQAGSGLAPGCEDRTAPISTVNRRAVRIRRRSIRITGTTRDPGCAGVRRVRVSIAREVGRRCRFLTANGRFTRARSCRRTSYLSARGTSRWTLTIRGRRLPRGRYKVWVRGIDQAGNVERKARRSNFKRVRAR